MISGVIFGRYRSVRLRVLHPATDLDGSVLDFDPTKIRKWYEDGLRTARGADSLATEPAPVVVPDS